MVSRRELLKRAALAGAAAVVPGTRTSEAAAAEAVPAPPAPAREPFANLATAEAEALEAMVARLIPADASGPGAAEAHAARYIDRALGSALSETRPAYAAGLASLDAYARSSRGARFVELSANDQDSVLIDVETGAATGFAGGSPAFFNLVRNHTLQGTFCDPYYGGNAGFVGWDLIGYPGVRTVVTPDQQKMGAPIKPNHRSAYDNEMFTKATARLGSPTGDDHGD